MKCIVIEDNMQDRELLKHYIQKEPVLQLIQSFENAVEAIPFINQFYPPLLFLDIEMPVLQGIDLYKSLDYVPICVFVTAYPEYAWESYEVQAFDFLLKPLTADRFARCINRICEYEQLQKRADLYDTLFETQSILLKEGTITYRIALNEIIYLEALSDYTKVVTKTRKYITLSKLKHFLEKLPAKDFIRIHRSFAVAKSAVNKIIGSDLHVEGQCLPIGKTYRPNLKKELTTL